MAVEAEPSNGLLFPLNVESSLLFESPAEIYARVFRDLRPRSPMPEIAVEFRRFAGANANIRLASGKLTVRISDLLEGAPAPVAESLAYILLSRLFHRRAPSAHLRRYRFWLNRREVVRTLHLVRGIRGRKRMTPPQGEVFDLETLFDELNRRYFGGLLGRPTLGWSHRRSRTRLGHFDPSHNAIVLSRILDGPEVPTVAVEYVLYHEMLHLAHPEQRLGSRRRIHTREFRQAERSYPRFAEAQAVLKALLS
jgi:hypothetical protein